MKTKTKLIFICVATFSVLISNCLPWKFSQTFYYPNPTSSPTSADAPIPSNKPQPMNKSTPSLIVLPTPNIILQR
jgi:hypothetical protein